jgi:hypothetical protein
MAYGCIVSAAPPRKPDRAYNLPPKTCRVPYHEPQSAP